MWPEFMNPPTQLRELIGELEARHIILEENAHSYDKPDDVISRR
jgi:hypothetical protein